MDIKISATAEGGRSIQALSNLIQQRMKWLGNSTDQALTSVAIQVLKSLRALTKIANPNKTKIVITPMASLSLSYTKQGGKNKPCLRMGKVRYIPTDGISIRYKSMDNKLAKVFKFVYQPLNSNRKRTYLIVANSKQEAKEIVKRRANQYKGLAKRALGQLMFKAARTSAKDNVSAQVAKKANELSKAKKEVRSTQDGKILSLDLYDDVVYAVSSLKNGESDIDTAIERAANKVAALINKACEDILGFQKIDIPFPK